MKSLLEGKKIILGVAAISFCAAGMAAAQTPVTTTVTTPEGATIQTAIPPVPQYANEAITAALKTTYENSLRVIGKLKDKNESATAKTYDFKLKSDAFRDRVDQALTSFAKVLDNDIAVELDGQIKDVAGVANDNGYTDKDKQEALPTLQTGLQNLGNRLSQRYIREVRKLYMIAGSLPVSCSPQHNNDEGVCPEILEKGWVNENQHYDPLFSDVNGSTFGFFQSLSQLYQKVDYPVLAHGCYSRSCIDYSVNEEVMFITMVHDAFDHPLEFSLNNRANIEIASPHVDIMGILLRVMTMASYPADNDNLPLMVTQSEMQQINDQIAAVQAAQAAQAQQQATQNQEEQYLAGLRTQRRALRDQLIAKVAATDKCDQNLFNQFCAMTSSDNEAIKENLVNCLSDQEKYDLMRPIYTAMRDSDPNVSRKDVNKHLKCIGQQLN